MSEPSPPEQQSRRIAFIALGVTMALGMAGAVLFAEPEEPATQAARVPAERPRPARTPSGERGAVSLTATGGGNLQCGDGSFREIPTSGALKLPAPTGEPLPCTVSRGRQMVCSGEIAPGHSQCTCDPATGRLTCA